MTRYLGIDPSTKTGIVAIDAAGNVLEAVEVNKTGDDPDRMCRIIDALINLLLPDDILTIEGFSFASKGAFVGQQYGIGWGIRMGLHRAGFSYIEATPSQLKKFATGKGVGKKEDLILPISDRWGFRNKSDNVRDAFVLAQIGRAIHEPVKLLAYQQDVIEAIRNPKSKKSK